MSDREKESAPDNFKLPEPIRMPIPPRYADHFCEYDWMRESVEWFEHAGWIPTEQADELREKISAHQNSEIYMAKGARWKPAPEPSAVVDCLYCNLKFPINHCLKTKYKPEIPGCVLTLSDGRTLSEGDDIPACPRCGRPVVQIQ